MSSAAKPVLVTGAGGFVGRHLVEALLARGLKVMALCRPRSLLPHHWQANVERIDCGDWSTGGVAKALGTRKFKLLFHLAAYGVVPTDRDPAQMAVINAELPERLVQLCGTNDSAMVMTGSSAEYLRQEGRIALSEGAPVETEKAYGASKAQGTTRACGAADRAGVPLRVLRLFNIFGPGEARHRLLPNLVAGLSANQRIALSEGSQVRDFVYVGDAVEALLAASDHIEDNPNAPATIWNVATGEGHTVREFSLITARLLGASERLLGFGDMPMRPDEIDWLVGDPARLRTQTGWAPRHDLVAGITASLAQMTGGSTLARAVP